MSRASKELLDQLYNRTRQENRMTIDLHGYHPATIRDDDLLEKLVQQAWELGKSHIEFIHGHGYNRRSLHPFANTNTGYLGLTVRQILRHYKPLRQWMLVKIDTSDPGMTLIRLRPNSNPTRSEIDALPERDFDDD